MKKLEAMVYTDRKYAGEIRIVDSHKAPFELCAMSVPGLNIPNPHPGNYLLTKVVRIPITDYINRLSYGPAIMYFTNVGELLALHGGETDERGNLFPTEGSLRVKNNDLEILLKELTGHPTRLVIRELTVSSVGESRIAKISERAPAPSVISTGPLKTLLTDPFFWLWLFDNHDSYQKEHGEAATVEEIPQTFHSGGGSSGGAGASGSFEPIAAAATTSNEESSSAGRPDQGSNDSEQAETERRSNDVEDSAERPTSPESTENPETQSESPES